MKAKFDIERVRARFPGRAILWVPSTRSTMEDAARLGNAPGSLVVAGEQTAGQGRPGKRWHSVADQGLYVSLVLPARGVTPVLTLALGLAAAESIAAAAGVACDLRWPNDVLIGEKKCAGILVQVTPDAAVSGIGVNLRQTDFPPELAGTATSLLLAGGRAVEREDLLIELAGSIDRHLELLACQGPGPILDLFAKASSYVCGRHVTVELDGRQVEGVTDGLDPTGFLWLRGEDGTRRLIVSGGVRPR